MSCMSLYPSEIHQIFHHSEAVISGIDLVPSSCANRQHVGSARCMVWLWPASAPTSNDMINYGLLWAAHICSSCLSIFVLFPDISPPNITCFSSWGDVKTDKFNISVWVMVHPFSPSSPGELHGNERMAKNRKGMPGWPKYSFTEHSITQVGFFHSFPTLYMRTSIISAP